MWLVDWGTSCGYRAPPTVAWPVINRGGGRKSKWEAAAGGRRLLRWRATPPADFIRPPRRVNLLDCGSKYRRNTCFLLGPIFASDDKCQAMAAGERRRTERRLILTAPTEIVWVSSSCSGLMCDKIKFTYNVLCSSSVFIYTHSFPCISNYTMCLTFSWSLKHEINGTSVY